jgi:hypothetical protein
MFCVLLIQREKEAALTSVSLVPGISFRLCGLSTRRQTQVPPQSQLNCTQFNDAVSPAVQCLPFAAEFASCRIGWTRSMERVWKSGGRTWM